MGAVNIINYIQDKAGLLLFPKKATTTKKKVYITQLARYHGDEEEGLLLNVTGLTHGSPEDSSSV